jgi:hypothetical protein
MRGNMNVNQALTVHQSDSICAAELNEHCFLGCLRFLDGPEPR